MVWVIAFGELFFGDLWCVVWGYGGMRTHFSLLNPLFRWRWSGVGKTKPPPGRIPMGVRMWAIRDSNPEPAVLEFRRSGRAN